METTKHFSFLFLLLLVALTAGAWAQGTETVLHSFTGAADGMFPYTGIVLDPVTGNLYGATSQGGNTECGANLGCGVFFQFSPALTGGWTESATTIFPGGATGGDPSGITLDSSGNLFISELKHGVGNEGQIVELTPNGKGGWIASIVHSFNGKTDGIGPYAVTLDSAGSVYGMTKFSPKGLAPTVFKVSRNGSGKWIEQTLYTFSTEDIPYYASVAVDPSGKLYGTLYGGVGDNCNCGTLFELSANPSGGVKFTNVHTFSGAPDGAGAAGNLLLDAAGKIYGTTLYGGNSLNNFGCGVVWEESPLAGGGWQYNILHTFEDAGDGCTPNGLTWDGSGNIYGAAFNSIYKLSPNGSGGWNFSNVANFNGDAGGYNSYGNIALDSAGNLYGTMLDGGTPSPIKDPCNSGCGVVYEVTP